MPIGAHPGSEHNVEIQEQVDEERYDCHCPPYRPSGLAPVPTLERAYCMARRESVSAQDLHNLAADADSRTMAV